MEGIKLFGVAGLAQSGKDTVSNMLGRHYEADLIAFADPIKLMLEIGLGITYKDLYFGDKTGIQEKYGVSVRHMMQSLATEWGRKYIGEDVWLRAVELHILANGNDVQVVTDVRFENEANWIREHGTLIHIHGRGGIPGNHVSEGGLLVGKSDIVIDNSGSMAELSSQVNHIVESAVN